MVKGVATSIITVATLMSCLVACSGSNSDAELQAKIADLEEELEELEESEELLSREDFVEKLRELEMKSEARNMKLVVE